MAKKRTQKQTFWISMVSAFLKSPELNEKVDPCPRKSEANGQGN